MTWLDYAVIGVLAVSVVWGAWRGFVREVISLAGWVIAFLVANLFATPLAKMLPDSMPRPEWHQLVAFVAIFLLALTVTTLTGVLLSKFVQKVGLGGLDRTLGGVFGLARGWLIALAFALLAGLTPLPLHPIWKESFTGPSLARSATYLKAWLPPAFADRLRYH
ncbi:MAG: CvpA family protein [Pseudomonadota bacterium]|nr:CvpA family protein [Pseudomonadota bacterium]